MAQQNHSGMKASVHPYGPDTRLKKPATKKKPKK